MPYYYYKFKTLIQGIVKYRVSLYASNASFYIILAFFPAVMLLVGLMPTVGFTQTDLLGAMSGVYYIQVGINAIYGCEEKRSYLMRRLMSMLYMIFLLIALIFTLLILGFGQEVALFLASQSVPVLNFIAEIMQFRGLILLLLLSLLFCIVYCVFPNQKVPLRKALPGAVLAALGWLVFTLGFSIYARYFSNYSVLYGSLSMIALGMLWLYVCISILFYGCVLNHYLDKE